MLSGSGYLPLGMYATCTTGVQGITHCRAGARKKKTKAKERQSKLTINFHTLWTIKFDKIAESHKFQS